MYSLTDVRADDFADQILKRDTARTRHTDEHAMITRVCRAAPEILQWFGHGLARLTLVRVQARIEAQLPFRDFVILASREFGDRFFWIPLRNGAGRDVDGFCGRASGPKELDYVIFEHAPEHIAC
jgi:hypothetical protein